MRDVWAALIEPNAYFQDDGLPMASSPGCIFKLPE